MTPLRQTHRIAVVVTVSEGVESRLLANVADALCEIGAEHELLRSEGPSGFRYKHLKSLATADIVLLHSPLLFALPHAATARLLGKKIVSMVWDSYPVKLNGVRYDKRLRRRILDRIENFVLSLSSRILVPSFDFLDQKNLAGAAVTGLWHRLDAPPVNIGRQLTGPDSPLRILFAGQINQTRGLVRAVSRLDEVTQGRFELKVASGNALPPELSCYSKIEYVGKLARSDLRKVAAECDCGLVTLAEEFDGPGLPSKTFEYLEAGLPCLYYGKRLSNYLDVLERSGAGIDIGLDKWAAITREDIMTRKRQIAAAAARFSSAFELKPEVFWTQLTTIGT